MRAAAAAVALLWPVLFAWVVPGVTGQDALRRPPFLCDLVEDKGAPLQTTIAQIQNSTRDQPRDQPLPQEAIDVCMHTDVTAGAAGHTFPSAFAGTYVTLSNVVVTASGLNMDNGAYWVAVQQPGALTYAGLLVKVNVSRVRNHVRLGWRLSCVTVTCIACMQKPVASSRVAHLLKIGVP